MPKTYLHPRIHPRILLAAALSSGLLLLGGAGRLVWKAEHPVKAASQMVYAAGGYGTLVPAPTAAKTRVTGLKPHSEAAMLRHSLPDPIQPLRDAYNAGHYPAVEAAALRLVSQARTDRRQPLLEQAAQAGSLLAYSAARRHDLALARTRFAAVRDAAAKLPDKGKEAALPGEIAPTLEAEAAFQHAVCTGALGDRAGAETEYLAFMKRYPDSPLLHAAERRIEAQHGGDLPVAALAVWQQAKAVAAAHEDAERVAQSSCGPECLAELLRRRGEQVSAPVLAREMKTTGQGTSLAEVAEAAKRHGFAPQGLALTVRGLARQTLPAIALVTPGHYVLVEHVSPGTVTVWDPDARGIGHGASGTVRLADWQHEWQGTTLVLTAMQVARR